MGAEERLWRDLRHIRKQRLKVWRLRFLVVAEHGGQGGAWRLQTTGSLMGLALWRWMDAETEAPTDAPAGA